tara:strand:+ start:2412 stop:2849 length:438 start_codon:yes stop_codon:yes gene_type:complete
MAKTIEAGNTVTLHYTGTLEDGTTFDTSRVRDEPITVTVGAGQLIQGFNDALLEMNEGETKTFTLTSEEAYGERNPEQTAELARSVFPEDFEFTAGMTVPLTGPGGGHVLATLTDIGEEVIVADLNHPMAGKDLTFEVEVLTVEE